MDFINILTLQLDLILGINNNNKNKNGMNNRKVHESKYGFHVGYILEHRLQETEIYNMTATHNK